MAEGRMSSFRLCRRSGVLLSLLLSVISSTNRIAFADVVQRLEHDFLVKPEVKEFDEVSGQYFKADGEHAGCISVFTSSSFLIQENFGCCPGAQGLLVANGNLFVAGDGQICVFKIATLAALDPIGVDSFKGHQLTALDLDKTTNTLWTTSRSGEQDAPPSGQAMVAKIQLDSGEIQISGSPQKQSQSNSSSPRRALAPLGGGAAAQSAVDRRHLLQQTVAPAPELSTTDPDANEASANSREESRDSSASEFESAAEDGEDLEEDTGDTVDDAEDTVEETSELADEANADEQEFRDSLTLALTDLGLAQASEDLTSAFFQEAQAASFVNDDFEIEVNTTQLAADMPSVQAATEAQIMSDVDAIIEQIESLGSETVNNESSTQSLIAQVSALVNETEAQIQEEYEDGEVDLSTAQEYDLAADAALDYIEAEVEGLLALVPSVEGQTAEANAAAADAEAAQAAAEAAEVAAEANIEAQESAEESADDAAEADDEVSEAAADEDSTDAQVALSEAELDNAQADAEAAA
eukprot:CAMPEP_0118938746 /NCGR_PEP_ID=MMETSP1169-20130426/26940_1 /TAXON_ID=36882 /ORGANISM="Pyramimonas obovata, Strain CCMP722" /LENGTH=524 /DNA_ID=CAMNT_0006882795 /DNA_START=310 /DNA_END=1880 /DNA_ORIENTATION=+